MDEPRKHHYIPVCYLKQWANADDRRLCEHKLISGVGVKPRRTSPAGTGYKIDLYRVDGVPENIAHDLEKKFMHMVDTQASQSIEKIVAGSTDNWTGELRSAWTRFIVSLPFRNPEAVAALNDHIATMWTETMKELEEGYAERRKPDDPATLKEYYEKYLPGGHQIDAAKFLADLIDDDKIGQTIFGMKWARIDLTASSIRLLTSDRPIDMPLGLGDPKAYIAMPVAPKILFVAAHEQAVINGVRALKHYSIRLGVSRVREISVAFFFGNTFEKRGDCSPKFLDSASLHFA